MRWIRFLALAGAAASAASDGGATTRPALWADLADVARAQPAEFAAAALLRIAAAPRLNDIAFQRQIIEDAFHIAAGAQQPYARRNWTGNPASPLDKAYAQGLDACTLQCLAVHAMLAVDFKKARELFVQIPPPQIPRLTCEDSLVGDVSIFYSTAGEIAARAFSRKEIAEEEPFHLLQRYAAALTSPVAAAPIARMLAGASLKTAQFEALVDTFAGALMQLSGDDRSFSATAADDADAALAGLPSECARRQINAQPLLDAWRAYRTRQLSGARCADSVSQGPRPAAGEAVKPASVDGQASPPAECRSPKCRDLARQFSQLVMGPTGLALPAEQKATAEWGARLRQYLAALADWRGTDDPAECFRWKSRFYSDLFAMSPDGPDRDLLLSGLLMWLQQNGYQPDHRVEWFYPVNALIIRAFADPLGMQATMRQLRRSTDPVISLFAQLEQLLPRPIDQTIGLL